jgi:hypothetical protein
MLYSRPCILNCLVASISLFQLKTDCKRPLLSPINLRRGLTENTSCGPYPMVCDVTAYAEVCLRSRCPQNGYIIPLFYCCVRVMQGVSRAVAWQCMSQYYYSMITITIIVIIFIIIVIYSGRTCYYLQILYKLNLLDITSKIHTAAMFLTVE